MISDLGAAVLVVLRRDVFRVEHFFDDSVRGTSSDRVGMEEVAERFSVSSIQIASSS